MNWRTYWHEYMYDSWREWDWLPTIRYRRFKIAFYPKEINIDFLKWGIGIRWWRR